MATNHEVACSNHAGQANRNDYKERPSRCGAFLFGVGILLQGPLVEKTRYKLGNEIVVESTNSFIRYYKVLLTCKAVKLSMLNCYERQIVFFSMMFKLNPIVKK